MKRFAGASSYRRPPSSSVSPSRRSAASRRSRAAGSVFTAAQAQAGEAAYAQQCAGCHGADFRGGGDAPPVAGVDFRAKWGPRAINELFTYLVQTMPPDQSGRAGRSRER